jgi:hypothetical protein
MSLALFMLKRQPSDLPANPVASKHRDESTDPEASKHHGASTPALCNQAHDSACLQCATFIVARCGCLVPHRARLLGCKHMSSERCKVLALCAAGCVPGDPRIVMRCTSQIKGASAQGPQTTLQLLWLTLDNVSAAAEHVIALARKCLGSWQSKAFIKWQSRARAPPEACCLCWAQVQRAFMVGVAHVCFIVRVGLKQACVLGAICVSWLLLQCSGSVRYGQRLPSCGRVICCIACRLCQKRPS